MEGKFLWLGDAKFFVRGVTYGAFAPNSAGHQFPEPHEVARDFALMRRAGINTILTYTVPPRSLLDQAQEAGLRLIITTPWMEYACFLESQKVREQVRTDVRNGVAACAGHPAVLMYCVGKEIPPPIVRWHGARRVESFLGDLCEVAKEQDPDSLVTYTNYPSTEYLELPFVDVFTFNVYLHRRRDFCGYLSRLQHLAGERPFVLTEFGMCSFRHGREVQADFIDWQIEEIFDHGATGAVIFGWTDPFFQDGQLIEEWGFGLVDAENRPKPSYEAAQRRFTAAVPFPPERRWPKVSVVVATYNAASTLDDCLSSLARLNYPDYEVIVVNDGSTDASAAIMAKYPFRIITTKNQGVSAARNEGLRAALGEIIAYIDSDARADPDWLSYLVATYRESDYAGVGGPNPVPPEDGWLAKCVYRSPGGPTQVMLDDKLAEHIPGCNMSFRKDALEAVGGFDPIFTKAADDVDICWRLIDRGWRIGFSPSAVVWHHRRPSAKAYWRQQVGYGMSEAILERKFPNKFNPWGHTFWAGRIYAPYPFFRMFSRPVIYHGLWGSAGFQPMYDPGGGGVFSFLPRAMEFHFALAALMVVGLFEPWAFALAGAGLAYIVAYCFTCAFQARIDDIAPAAARVTWRDRLRWRLALAWLNFLEPVARDWGRLKGGLTPWRSAASHGRQQGARASTWWQRLQPFRRTARWEYKGNQTLEKFDFLERMTKKLIARGCAVGWNPDSQSWDLKLRRGALGEAQLLAVIEHHGGPRRLIRLAATIRPSQSIRWTQVLLIAAAAALAVFEPGGGLAIIGAFLAGLWIAPIAEATRLEAAIQAAAEETIVDLSATGADEATQSARPEAQSTVGLGTTLTDETVSQAQSTA